MRPSTFKIPPFQYISMKLSTGIDDLDLIMEGGYKTPANILIVGPSAPEKVALAYSFTSSEPSLIICGNSSASDVMKKASDYGINLGKCYFIDCYSATINKSASSDGKITIVPSPSALNDLSLAINEILKQTDNQKLRVVFDTLSTFVLYNQKDSIRKFLSVVEGRFKNADATVLYLVDEGVHEKQLLSILEHGMDEKILINEKEGKTYLQLPELQMQIPVKCGRGGFEIL